LLFYAFKKKRKDLEKNLLKKKSQSRKTFLKVKTVREINLFKQINQIRKINPHRKNRGKRNLKMSNKRITIAKHIKLLTILRWVKEFFFKNFQGPPDGLKRSRENK